MSQLQLLTGRSHPTLAAEVAKHLNHKVCPVILDDFANSEINCKIAKSVRGNNVFILQTHGHNVNHAIMEQVIMIDAAKRASAASITAICPILGYARQDRKSSGRQPIGARLVIDMLTAAGADRIMSIDLHSNQIQGFFDGPFDHLTATSTLIEYIKNNIPNDNLVIVSPDAGRVKSAERYGSVLNCGIAIIHKHRSTEARNQSEARYLIGNVRGKVCVIIDDMIDTAGTICSAADLLAKHGATEIYGVVTHGVLSDPAMDRINASAFKKVIVTDTLDQSQRVSDKLEVVSIAPLIGAAIQAITEGASVSAIFGGNNQM